MPALQNFIDNSLPTIKAAWLNQVDAFVNTLFAGATTASLARDALSISAQPVFRNKLFNAKFQFAQFNNSVTAGSGYVIDMWRADTGATGTFTISRVQATGLADFPYFGRVLSGAANTVSAGSYWGLQQRIEGIHLDDLNYGTSSAVVMTLSFWARTSVPGTYSVSLRNGAADRSFVSTFTSTDNLWHFYSITIPGDLAGTWAINAAVGLQVMFLASGGTTYQTSVLNTWQSGNFITANTQTQLMATNGATFDITGVQLEKGIAATPFEHILHAVDLQRCQRYYEQILISIGGMGTTGAGEVWTLPERAIKRATPVYVVLQVINVTNVSNAAYGYAGAGPGYVVLTVPTGAFIYQILAASDARL